LELEVPVAERLDDRAKVRELLRQQVGHRAAAFLVDDIALRRDRVPVHGARVPRDGDALRAVVRQELEQHVREAEQRVRRAALGRRELLREREVRPIGEVVAVDEKELTVTSGRVVEVELEACERLRGHRSESTASGKQSGTLVRFKVYGTEPDSTRSDVCDRD